MVEVLKVLEKKIMPALMVALIECQGGKAFAGDLPIPHVQAEEQQKQSVYETFGEGYRLFESAIDDTSDDELKAAGILTEGDSPTQVRKSLKKALPLLWIGWGTQAWDILAKSYAVAHYDILTNGARLFFKIEHQEKITRFDSNDLERLIDEIVYRIWELTGIPVDRITSENDANCVITIMPVVPPGSKETYGLAAGPSNSFKKFSNKIFLNVADLAGVSRYAEEDPDVEKFLLGHAHVESAAHEFCHVLGLQHSNDSKDLMYSGGRGVGFKTVDDPSKFRSKDIIYSKRLQQYITIAFESNAEKSPSIKLVRWLRWQAMRGALKGLLERAEELAVKRPVKQKENK